MKTKILTTLFVMVFSCAMVFGQDTTRTEKKQTVKTNMEMQKDSVYYSCTTHPEVKMDSPGKCPKCGKDLVKTTVKKSEGVTSYTCTMHPDVTSDKPGKCPKCGKDLVVKK